MLFKVWRKDGYGDSYLVIAASRLEAIYKVSQDQMDLDCGLTAKVVIFKDSGVQDTKEERLRV